MSDQTPADIALRYLATPLQALLASAASLPAALSFYLFVWDPLHGMDVLA